MKDVFVAILLIMGSFFMFLAGLGTFRFPDLYSRMHAATKASSFGIGLMLTGFILYSFSWYLFIESLLIMAFIFITAPVAAHMLGRAGYLLNVPQYEKTVIDEMTTLYENNDEGKK